MGNDVTITIAGASGHFELNVYKPVLIHNLLQSIKLLGDACASFTDHCVVGIEARHNNLAENLRRSLMLVTALSPVIGYDKAAKVAKQAHQENRTLREVAVSLGYITPVEFDAIVDPHKMY
jgi:fumarate hydratase class II